MSEVNGALQHPQIRTRRVGKLDQDVGHMKELSEVQGDIDLVVLSVSGKRRTLPPPLCPIDGIGDRVSAVTLPQAADVTVLALDGLAGVSGYRASHQFTVQVMHGAAALVLSTRRGGRDFGALRQVEIRRV